MHRIYFDGGVAGFTVAFAGGGVAGVPGAGAVAGGGVAPADGAGCGAGVPGGVGRGAGGAAGVGGLSEMLISSTSKTRFVFAGIFGGLPIKP